MDFFSALPSWASNQIPFAQGVDRNNIEHDAISRHPRLSSGGKLEGSFNFRAARDSIIWKFQSA
jgi:hypothetical protein